MVSNRMTDGVGKRIVDALKQQDNLEIRPVEDISSNEESFEQPEYDNTFNEDTDFSDDVSYTETPQNNYSHTDYSQMTFENVQNREYQNDVEDFEIPSNVAVLRQLINKLPAGVSKQTGAQIIKQTMEALGISMQSVLQEAQQVQDNLNGSVKECQASIVEHKKQINALERQTQKLQKQYSVLNDIISLFVQTSM